MPYLNWKEQNLLRQEIAPESGPIGSSRQEADKMRLTLTMDSALLGGLLPYLRETFANDGAGELRLDLPRNWIVFWKKREGESRLLLAHPQPDEWVSTMALSAEHGQRLLGALEGLKPGQNVHLSELEETGKVSNLELTLVHI